MFAVISSLEHVTIQVPINHDTEDYCMLLKKKLPLIALSAGMYDVIQLVICGIIRSKLEIPEEGNDVLNA